MLNEKAPPNARVAAANTLLDRAYGKAPTFSTTDPGTFNIIRSGEELEKIDLLVMPKTRERRRHCNTIAAWRVVPLHQERTSREAPV